jgi:hypothetical protein
MDLGACPTCGNIGVYVPNGMISSFPGKLKLDSFPELKAAYDWASGLFNGV